MNVLKAYAHQVATYHPEKVQDDLFAEVYDELCEEYGDWLELNHGKTEVEFLDAGKEHPARYATRLVSDKSAYLVGPQYYFSLLSALKTGAIITAGFCLVMGIISALASGEYWGAFWRMLASIPTSLLWVSASILGVFVALEKSGERASWLDNWKAGDLKRLESHKQISPTETYFDLAISSFLLLWLADVIRFPMVIRYDGIWTPDWIVNLPPLLWSLVAVLLVFDIGFCVIRLARKFWSRNLRLVTIVTNLVWIAVFIFAVVQPQLVSAQESATGDIPQLVPLVNMLLDGLLIGITVIIAWDTFSHLRQITKD